MEYVQVLLKRIGSSSGTKGSSSVNRFEDDAVDRDMSLPDADDFMPVFMYILLKACIPRLASNLEYISIYRNPTVQMGREGW